MTAIATDVAQEHRRAAALRNQQARCAIAEVIRSQQRPRMREMNFVEAEFFRNVAKASRAFIAKKSNLTLIGGIFSNYSEIEPAVVVVIERGDAPGVFPTQRGQIDVGEALAVDVAPQRKGRRGRMGEGQIHPAIFVEVESHSADAFRHLRVPRAERTECSFARVQIDNGRINGCTYGQIDGTVIVDVAERGTVAGGPVEPNL